MKKKTFSVGPVECGSGKLFLVAGPCVIEAETLMLATAEKLKKLTEDLDIPLIFKSSFLKDNRSSLDYYQGPGINEGLRILEKIKTRFGIPVMSDVHYPGQIPDVKEVLDIIQIPAYLCMQTELVVSAAKSGRPVNLKHGQFLAPANMRSPVRKAEDSGCRKILLTERGYTFGYNDLVVDPRSFYFLNQTGYPVVFDITHSIRRYGIPSADPRGGNREFLPVIARAGVAAGVDGLFIETHPDPPRALCDATTQMALDDLGTFLKPLLEIHQVVRSQNNAL